MIRQALVLGANSTALGMVRNLGEAGVRAHVLGRGGPALLSRHAISHQSDTAEPTPQEVLRLVGQLAGQEPIYVAPSSDPDILTIEACREELEDIAVVGLGNAHAVAKSFNKADFHDALASAGLPVPKTWRLKNASASMTLPSDLSFPCLLKSESSAAWKTGKAAAVLGAQKLLRAEDEAQLRDLLGKMAGQGLIAQVVVPHDEGQSWSYCCLAGEGGKPLWGFVTRKLMQFPRGFGTALVCGIQVNGDVEGLGQRVIQSIGLDGVAEVEMVVDREGKLWVIEVNARHWMQHRLSRRLGVNLTHADILLRSGKPQELEALLSKGAQPASTESSGHVWLDELGYVMACGKSLTSPQKLYLGAVLKRIPECMLWSPGDAAPLKQGLRRKIFG